MQNCLARTALYLGVVFLVVPTSVQAQDPVIKPTPTTVTRLPAPRAVVGRQLPDGRIEVRWARVPGASAYLVTRSVPNLGSGRISPDPTDTMYVDHDVRRGYTYYYVVQGIDDGGGVGLKAGSNAVLASIAPGGSVAPAPTVTAHLQPLSATNIQVTVAWGAVAGAVSYVVEQLEYRSASPADPTAPDLTKPPVVSSLGPTASTSKVFGTLLRATPTWWSYRVTPRLAAGEGVPGVSSALYVGPSASPAVGESVTPAAATGSTMFLVASPITLASGATASLAANAGGAGARWISMNDAVATVDASGTVTGRASGSTYIVALFAGADGSFRATAVRVTIGP